MKIKSEKLANKIEYTGLNFENKEKTDELANSILKEPPENELHITKVFFESYQRSYGARHDIKVSEHTIEYANILIAQRHDEATSVADLIEGAIKQSLCFEALKMKNGDNKITQKDLFELHERAEILAKQIEHKDLGYDKKYEFDKLVTNIANEPVKNSSSSLSEKEMEKLSQVFQKEFAQEQQQLQMEHQRQLERQRSRGFEIEF